jgi:hypothetical protein
MHEEMEDAQKRRERKERNQNRHELLTNDTRIVHGTETKTSVTRGLY